MNDTVPMPASRPIPIRATRPQNPDNGYKISVRFGDQVLQAGFTSVPNLVLNHYAELGITPAEMMFTIHMWQFRWTERDPYPSLTTIADKMDVSWRQAHRYAKSLEQKGFLIINSRQEPGRGQVTSEYDFEPLIQAVINLDRSNEHHSPHQVIEPQTSPQSTLLTKMTGGGVTDLTEAPLSQMSDEEYKGQKDPSQEDVNLSNIRKAKGLKDLGKQADTSQMTRQDTPAYKQPENEREREQRSGNGGRGQGFSSIGDALARSNLRVPPKPYGEERQVIMDYVAKFAKEFNDHASLKTSTTRAYNLFTKSRVPLGSFIGRMYEAHAITKESAAAVPRRPNPTQSGTMGVAPRGRPAKNRMAYWFSVLEDRLGLRSKKAGRGERGEGKDVQKSS
jgi:hypothetical protein